MKLNASNLTSSKDDEIITQRAYDAKVVLIMGHWDQVDASGESAAIKAIKQKTFELYRRDSRNIEIITYDELFERARFIPLSYSKKLRSCNFEG